MHDLVPQRHLLTNEEQGRRIYKSNPFLKTLSNVMESPDFQKLRGEYMSDRCDAQTVLMFMGMYDALSSNRGLNKYQKIATIREAIDNPELRHSLVQDFGCPGTSPPKLL